MAESKWPYELEKEAVGKRIKIRRVEKGLRQETLAEMVCISPNHLSNIERGACRISLVALLNIANALEVTTDDLLRDVLRKSKEIYLTEADEIFKDTSEYETRVLVESLAAQKAVLRKNRHLRLETD